MRQTLAFFRRHPVAALVLLPVAGLPLASLIVNSGVMPLVLAVCPVPPILGMIVAQGLVSLLAAGAYYALRGGNALPLRDDVPSEVAGWNWLWDGVLPLMVILLAVNKFYLTSVPWEVGPHRFFDELGLDAAYLERLFQGDLYFRDCVMIYNVLMFWPVFLLMKAFGHQLWVLQAWSLLLELVCLGGLYAALRFLTEDRWLSLVGLGLCVFLFYPDVPYPHASYSRYHLGLFPGLAAAWAWRRGKKTALWLGGLPAAVYFLYTYDYGLVSCAALSFSGLMVSPKDLRKSKTLLLAWALPVVLFFLWLARIKGGIGAAAETLFYFPLHYHASDVWWPFPHLWRDTVDLFTRPGLGTFRTWLLAQLAHGPYVIYGLALLGLWIGHLSRMRADKKFLTAYLLIFAWGCAPKYIFRTGYLLTGTHLYLAPAVLLAFGFMAAWGKFSHDARRWETRLVAGSLLLLLVGFLRCHWDPSLTARLLSHPAIPGSAPAPAGYRPLNTPSTQGIFVPATWDLKIEALQGRLSVFLGEEKDLYIYPYDPAWYFLLGRKNAGPSDITGDVLPGGWKSVFDAVKRSRPAFILISNFAGKPDPAAELRRPLDDLLAESYREEWADGAQRLYRKIPGE